MGVAPAAAEVAVVTEAGCKGGACSSMQQQRCGCGSEQHALVEPQAVADGGTIAMDGRLSACVRQWAADVACAQQRAAERCVCGNVQWQRRVCGSG